MQRSGQHTLAHQKFLQKTYFKVNMKLGLNEKEQKRMVVTQKYLV